MTLDEFMVRLRAEVEEFERAWRDDMASSPQEFPNEFPNESDWWEQFDLSRESL